MSSDPRHGTDTRGGPVGSPPFVEWSREEGARCLAGTPPAAGRRVRGGANGARAGEEVHRREAYVPVCLRVNRSVAAGHSITIADGTSVIACAAPRPRRACSLPNPREDVMPQSKDLAT